jgi:hypothetical protein
VLSDALWAIPLHTIALDSSHRSHECFKNLAVVTGGSVRRMHSAGALLCSRGSTSAAQYYTVLCCSDIPYTPSVYTPLTSLSLSTPPLRSVHQRQLFLLATSEHSGGSSAGEGVCGECEHGERLK